MTRTVVCNGDTPPRIGAADPDPYVIVRVVRLSRVGGLRSALFVALAAGNVEEAAEIVGRAPSAELERMALSTARVA